MNNNNIKK